MRVLVAIVLVFISAAAAFADSPGERVQGDRKPTATEVIAGLYAFSRFQQGLLESTDLKGNAEVKNLAALRAEEAARRDRALKEIQQAIGAEPRLDKAASIGASLSEADSADGPAFVRSFYAAQIAEYESAIALFESYLREPDNAALAHVRDDQRTIADK